MFRISKLVFLIIIVLSGCSQILNLSENDKSLQPYEEGQFLMFINSTKDIDTFKVVEIREQMNPKDYLTLFGSHQESLHVFFSNISKDIEKNKMFEVMSLTATEDGTFIRFGLKSNLATFYDEASFNVESLKPSYIDEFERKCIKIESKDTFFKDRSNQVSTMYWNLEQGLMGYDMELGEKWRKVKDINKEEFEK